MADGPGIHVWVSCYKALVGSIKKGKELPFLQSKSIATMLWTINNYISPTTFYCQSNWSTGNLVFSQLPMCSSDGIILHGNVLYFLLKHGWFVSLDQSECVFYLPHLMRCLVTIWFIANNFTRKIGKQMSNKGEAKQTERRKWRKAWQSQCYKPLQLSKLPSTAPGLGHIQWGCDRKHAELRWISLVHSEVEVGCQNWGNFRVMLED